MNQITLDLQPEPEYRKIPLTQGQFALVDAADFDWLNQWKWAAWKAPNSESFYAVRNGPVINGKRSGYFYMHRQILGAKQGQQVDHIWHNTLDNRRSQIRLATNTENQRNRRIGKNNTSGFRGVSWDSARGKWFAHIRVNNKTKPLGRYNTAAEASAVYERTAKALFGTFYCDPSSP